MIFLGRVVRNYNSSPVAIAVITMRKLSGYAKNHIIASIFMTERKTKSICCCFSQNMEVNEKWQGVYNSYCS